MTGSRADYGLLRGLLADIRNQVDMRLCLIVTGTHLSAQHGRTVDQIRSDGFEIDAKVESLAAGDSAVAIGTSIGLGVIGFAAALERLRPDLLVVLGDRFEIVAAVQAALVAMIPVAHIAGGDLTEGAYDEAFRHAITKMAHLHFVTHDAARARVVQMGEAPEYVFQVGHLGLDIIKREPVLERAEVEHRLGFRFRGRNLLVTFHPATLDVLPAFVQMQELLAAIDRLGSDVGTIFTYPNADRDGLGLIRAIDEFVASRPNCMAFPSLGSSLYLNLMRQVDAVVGNSSSGIYEAPSLHKPSVNIGTRQRGRMQAASVIDCDADRDSIAAALEKSWQLDCTAIENPYGDGETSARIISVIRNVASLQSLIQKRFFEISHGD